MVEAVVTYLIVSVAAVWVLWSILLPAGLRRAIRQRFTGRPGVRAAPGAMSGCDDCHCPGCGRRD